MKKVVLSILFVLISFCYVEAQNATFNVPQASAEAQQWFNAKFKKGFKSSVKKLGRVKAYDQIDVQTFYEQYQKAPQMWDSIFQWLSEVDPTQLEPSNCAMRWSHAFVKVLNQDLRTPEWGQWEQHRRTIDLQWDVTGSERYEVTHSPECLTAKNEYNEKRDVQNFTWDRKLIPTANQCLVLDSDPNHFYLFFPTDIHQACGIGNQPCVPRKIVVKIDFLK